MVNGIVGQSFTIALTPLDATGKVGTVDAPPTYPVDVAGVVTIHPAADGLSAVVQLTAVGTANITPSATAAGKPITGAVIQVVVAAPPPLPAVTLAESISTPA